MTDKTCISLLATRPVLYTDTVGGKQTCRDDLWAVTTDELNALLRQAAPVAPTLPNGWKLEQGGDDIRLMRADGKWCGYSPDIDSPAHRLTLEFLRDLIAAPATQQAGAAEKVSCPECSGTGSVMMDGDCSDCNGKGYDWEPIDPAATTASAERDYSKLCRDCCGPIGEDHSENCGIARGPVLSSHCGEATTASESPLPPVGTAEYMRARWHGAPAPSQEAQAAHAGAVSEQQLNVSPPTRGTGSQHDAGAAVLSALRDGIPLQEPVNITKAVLAQREARVSLSGGTGPVACAMLVNIQLTPWADGPEKAEAFASGYNTAMKWYRAALLELAEKAEAEVKRLCCAQRESKPSSSAIASNAAEQGEKNV